MLLWLELLWLVGERVMVLLTKKALQVAPPCCCCNGRGLRVLGFT